MSPIHNFSLFSLLLSLFLPSIPLVSSHSHIKKSTTFDFAPHLKNLAPKDLETLQGLGLFDEERIVRENVRVRREDVCQKQQHQERGEGPGKELEMDIKKGKEGANDHEGVLGKLIQELTYNKRTGECGCSTSSSSGNMEIKGQTQNESSMPSSHLKMCVQPLMKGMGYATCEGDIGCAMTCTGANTKLSSDGMDCVCKKNFVPNKAKTGCECPSPYVQMSSGMKSSQGSDSSSSSQPPTAAAPYAPPAAVSASARARAKARARSRERGLGSMDSINSGSDFDSSSENVCVLPQNAVHAADGGLFGGIEITGTGGGMKEEAREGVLKKKDEAEGNVVKKDGGSVMKNTKAGFVKRRFSIEDSSSSSSSFSGSSSRSPSSSTSTSTINGNRNRRNPQYQQQQQQRKAKRSGHLNRSNPFQNRDDVAGMRKRQQSDWHRNRKRLGEGWREKRIGKERVERSKQEQSQVQQQRQRRRGMGEIVLAPSGAGMMDGPFGVDATTSSEESQYQCPISELGVKLMGCKTGKGGGWECLDTSSNAASCGGCTSEGTGRDCGKIPGVKGYGCESSHCVVLSCKAEEGWLYVDGWIEAPAARMESDLGGMGIGMQHGYCIRTGD